MDDDFGFTCDICGDGKFVETKRAHRGRYGHQPVNVGGTSDPYTCDICGDGRPVENRIGHHASHGHTALNEKKDELFIQALEVNRKVIQRRIDEEEKETIEEKIGSAVLHLIALAIGLAGIYGFLWLLANSGLLDIFSS